MTKEYKLSEYKPLDYLVEHIDLTLDLTKPPIQSSSVLHIIPNPQCQNHPNTITLDGKNMTLSHLTINKLNLNNNDFEISDESLTIKNIPQNTKFTIEATTLLGENTDLFGLYETEGVILVKAETEGLRRVLYCNDRPDNLSTFKTTIIADKERYPVLLSNGICVKQLDLNDGRHETTWVDMVPKPSYLFAIVAGSLTKTSDHFKSKQGKTIAIECFVPNAALKKCEFAKEVIKAAMHWDEQVCALDCELTQHMIAGVDKYASGASEPTGLNLFNTDNLYATAATKTDLGMLRVLEVVAHEYFHYWTGDLVTIRDWFNLAFKEGLTTLRAELFREEFFGTDVVRLLDGKNLDERAPRPETYTAVRSLYTAAAYEKSASIFRMIMILMGKTKFLAGLTSFLKDHRGQAVTLEQLLSFLNTWWRTTKPSTNLAELDLHEFIYWFSESGIPKLTVTDKYNETTNKYTLVIKTEELKNRPITLLMGAIDAEGNELIKETILLVNNQEMEFSFDNIPNRPIPSLLRSFSAPVELQYDYTVQQLLSLIQYDSNLYNRCEAAKRLFGLYANHYTENQPLECELQFLNAFNSLLKDNSLNSWLLAELYSIPTLEDLVQNQTASDFEKISNARQAILLKLSTKLDFDLLQDFGRQSTEKKVKFPMFDLDEAGNRRLNFIRLTYLLQTDKTNTIKHVIEQFKNNLQTNMTQTINALILLCEYHHQEAEKYLTMFYDQWKHDTHAMNYWFTVQAASHADNVVDKVKQLINHPAFDISIPNKIYALIGTFSKNAIGFHCKSGEGYQLVADMILKLDSINPSVAARLTDSFNSCDKLDDLRKEMMYEKLKYIYDNAKSNDVKSAVKKSLDKISLF